MTARRIGDAVGLVLVAAGAIAILLAWRSIAATDVVPRQLAYLASGGLTGLGLIGTGCGVIVIQRSREGRAVERRALTAIGSTAARQRSRGEDR